MDQTFLKFCGDGGPTTCAFKPRALCVMSSCLNAQETFAEEFWSARKNSAPRGVNEFKIPHGNEV